MQNAAKHLQLLAECAEKLIYSKAFQMVVNSGLLFRRKVCRESLRVLQYLGKEVWELLLCTKPYAKISGSNLQVGALYNKDQG